MSMSAPVRHRWTPGPVGDLVGREAARLQRGHLADWSAETATLARLRRGAGRDPLSTPELWGAVDIDALHDTDGIRGEKAMSQAQNAVFAALALYAVHQQSRSQGMHLPGGNGLGQGVRRLMPNEVDTATLDRFRRLGSATTFAQLAVRLREIATLLRREDIPLDYALLGEQLYQWQLPGQRDKVRQQWGRSYHQHRRDTEAAHSADTPAEK